MQMCMTKHVYLGLFVLDMSPCMKTVIRVFFENNAAISEDHLAYNALNRPNEYQMNNEVSLVILVVIAMSLWSIC